MTHAPHRAHGHGERRSAGRSPAPARARGKTTDGRSLRRPLALVLALLAALLLVAAGAAVFGKRQVDHREDLALDREAAEVEVALVELGDPADEDRHRGGVRPIPLRKSRC